MRFFFSEECKNVCKLEEELAREHGEEFLEEFVDAHTNRTHVSVGSLWGSRGT